MQLQAKVNNPSSFLLPLDTTFLFCSPQICSSSLWSNPDATSLCTVLGTQKLEGKQEKHKKREFVLLEAEPQRSVLSLPKQSRNSHHQLHLKLTVAC